ncbi:MAG: gliding motility-associated C-terminal domain-containing protein [Bacteroidota bacterium]
MLRVLLLTSFVILVQSLNAQSCPAAIGLGVDTTICPGETVDLIVTDIPAEVLTTTWSPTTDLILNIDGINAAVTPTASTTYTVEMRYLTGPELVFNGDFSQGDTGFNTDYDFGNSSGGNGPLDDEGQYRITDDPPAVHEDFGACGDHTSGSGNMMVVNGSNSQVDVWCQTIAVDPNVDYAFSAYVTTMVALNPAILQFSINGTLFGDPFPAPSQICPWNQFFALWNSGGDNSAEICIRNLNTNGSGNDFAIDDISFRRTCLTDASQEVSLAPPVVAEIEGDLEYCQNQGIINLNTILSAGSTPAGIWTVDGLPLPSGSLDFSTLLIGPHSLQYEVGQAGCTTTDQLDFNLVAPANAGVTSGNGSHCVGETQAFDLFSLLSNFDTGGAWALPPVLAGTPFSPVSGMVDLRDAVAGNYDFTYTVDPGTACGPAVSTVTVVISPAPFPAQAPIDLSLDCIAPEVELSNFIPALNEVSYLWTRNGVTVANQAQFLATQAGNYQLEVSANTSGCTSQLEINLIDNRTEPSFELLTDSVRCGPNNEVAQGQIVVSNPSGGSAPYLYRINEGSFQADSSFTDLGPGNYDISVEDAGGCQSTVSVLLPDPLDFVLSLVNNSPDNTGFGEAINISLQSNLPLSDLANLSWEPLGVGDTGALSITLLLSEPLVIVAEITTGLGCSFRAELPVGPTAENILFAPTAFSPNGDGINDSWLPFGSQAVAQIKQVQIFDRWGSPVFVSSENRPGDLSAGWDGRVRGQLAQIGVYGYFVEVELLDGTSQVFSGEINLIR